MSSTKLTKEAVEQALSLHGGVQALAARALGVPERTFRDAVRRLGARRSLAVNTVPAATAKYEEFVRRVCSVRYAVPNWVLESSSPSKVTMVGTVLSDIHYEEVVRPAEIHGMNEYSPEVARLRLRRYFDGVPRVSKEVLSGLNNRGIVLVLGGDNFTGTIHEELAETNALSSLEALLELSTLLSAGIKQWADEFGRVHIVGVPGNHSRLTKKPRYKRTAATNIDWFLYHLVAREFKDDTRVSFNITESPDTFFEMFGWRFLATHGDQARGGGGAVIGMYGPLLNLLARKRRWAQQTGNHFDYLTVGHWHNHDKVGPVIANGCVIGYNEYAHQRGFDFQPPQQAFWITHPLRGVTFHTPIFLEPPQGPPRLASLGVS